MIATPHSARNLNYKTVQNEMTWNTQNEKPSNEHRQRENAIASERKRACASDRLRTHTHTIVRILQKANTSIDALLVLSLISVFFFCFAGIFHFIMYLRCGDRFLFFSLSLSLSLYSIVSRIDSAKLALRTLNVHTHSYIHTNRAIETRDFEISVCD